LSKKEGTVKAMVRGASIPLDGGTRKQREGGRTFWFLEKSKGERGQRRGPPK